MIPAPTLSLGDSYQPGRRLTGGGELEHLARDRHETVSARAPAPHLEDGADLRRRNRCYIGRRDLAEQNVFSSPGRRVED